MPRQTAFRKELRRGGWGSGGWARRDWGRLGGGRGDGGSGGGGGLGGRHRAPCPSTRPRRKSNPPQIPKTINFGGVGPQTWDRGRGGWGRGGGARRGWGRLDRGRGDGGRGGWGGLGGPGGNRTLRPLPIDTREEKATQPQIPKTINFGGRGLAGGAGSPKPPFPIPLPSRRPRNLLGAHEDGRPHADPRAPGAQSAPADSMCSVLHSPLLRTAF